MANIQYVPQIVTTEQLYHRKMVCFRYVIVNTLHKGDNKRQRYSSP